MIEHNHPIVLTQRWLERAVIGLNLCPFAKAVHVKSQIAWVVSGAQCENALLADLEREMLALVAADPQLVDTTMLLHPQVLTEFFEFSRFLPRTDTLLNKLGLHGVLQVASFHPQYQFADSAADDVGNCTNRSPVPCLHLLREASVARAVAAFPDAALIYSNNIATLRALGLHGWRHLLE
jgi:uncharacterized protein